MEKLSDGTRADPPYTPTVTWDMRGTASLTQKLHMQRYDSKSHERLLRLQRHRTLASIQYAMNITDVEDKIINRSNEEGIEYFEFAKRWENDFFADMKQLGVENPNYLTRVTEYVPEIVKFIEKVVENGFAYPSKGSVYFDIKQY